MEFRILFENDDILAVEKPTGISTIFERKRIYPCLIQSLREQTQLPLMAVHRLDKEVSGAILFAKHKQAHKKLNLKFDYREITKTYIALVHGDLPFDQGEVNKPIRQFGSGRMGVYTIHGKESVTKIILEKKNADFSRVRLSPITGRRHQLRVHLYSIGHPIVGDLLYGERAVQSQYPRLMLHAHQIEFEWENMGMVRIESVIPEIFDQYI